MWWIYALGGGWGHLTRAVALARIVRREREVRVLANTPYARYLTGEADLVGANPARAIAESPPDTLIVDTFPRGLGGELAPLLPGLKCRKALVHRDLNPRYVAWASLREFVERHYDLVLVPGEPAPLDNLPAAVRTEPWLVRSAHELPPRDVAEPFVLVCAAGKREELAWYGAVAAALSAHATVRCVAAECPPGCKPELWIRHWPAIELIASASVVVGGAGYNTVNECLACHVPLVARAWPRTYDRQAERTARAGITAVETVEEAVQAALARFGGIPGPPAYRNGAEEAAAILSGNRPPSAPCPTRGGREAP